MSGDVQRAVTWSDVAPLLARWQMALCPNRDRSWDVLSGFPGLATMPRYEARRVDFAALPQAIVDVAARCEHEEKSA